MNRKTRRKYERQFGKVYSMQRYRDEAIEIGERNGVKMAVDMILYMTAYTINYKLGFGKKRLLRIMSQITDNIDAYNTGHLTHEDYEEIKRMMNKLGFFVKGG